MASVYAEQERARFMGIDAAESDDLPLALTLGEDACRHRPHITPAVPAGNEATQPLHMTQSRLHLPGVPQQITRCPLLLGNAGQDEVGEVAHTFILASRLTTSCMVSGTDLLVSG